MFVHLQPADDLFQRQGALRAADEGRGGEPEHLVQVRLVQPIEAYMKHRRTGGGSRSGGVGEKRGGGEKGLKNGGSGQS